MVNLLVEIWVQIFEYFNGAEYSQLVLVCNEWKNIISTKIYGLECLYDSVISGNYEKFLKNERILFRRDNAYNYRYGPRKYTQQFGFYLYWIIGSCKKFKNCNIYNYLCENFGFYVKAERLNFDTVVDFFMTINATTIIKYFIENIPKNSHLDNNKYFENCEYIFCGRPRSYYIKINTLRRHAKTKEIIELIESYTKNGAFYHKIPDHFSEWYTLDC